jgi:hypothetical protein
MRVTAVAAYACPSDIPAAMVGEIDLQPWLGESTNRASIWHPCHQAGAREYVFVLFSSSLTEDDIGLARGF